MTQYAPPLDEFRFALNHLLDFDLLASFDRYSELDADLIDAVLGEAGKFFAEQWFPLNKTGDEVGSKLVDGAVVTPEGFRRPTAWLPRTAGWVFPQIRPTAVARCHRS